ncbi:MAG: hypothetical protein R2688_03520 [Fimbriimonadaceae bacterium]
MFFVSWEQKGVRMTLTGMPVLHAASRGQIDGEEEGGNLQDVYDFCNRGHAPDLGGGYRW